MFNHPLTWFVLGMGTVWGYHHFVKPLPGAATS
jgi:hypothetical protein